MRTLALLFGLLLGLTRIAPAQHPGTIEVGFFGSSAEAGLAQESQAALVTVFVANRVAIEAQQQLLSIARVGGERAMWAVYAVPLFRAVRLHAGPGLRLSASGQGRLKPHPGLVLGTRWTAQEWLGLRLDVQMRPGRDGRDFMRPAAELYGGLSVRVRG